MFLWPASFWTVGSGTLGRISRVTNVRRRTCIWTAERLDLQPPEHGYHLCVNGDDAVAVSLRICHVDVRIVAIQGDMIPAQRD